MRYQLDDGWTEVEFVRPAHGLVALHGADVVPVNVLGLAAGRTTQGHRFEARLPAIDLRDADSYAAQLRDDGAVLASFDERRAEIDAQLAAAAAREGPAADRRRGPARRGHGAGRAPERAALPLRRGVPRRAAGVPRPDDEGEPEVLSLARCRRPPDEPLSRRQQRPAGRSFAHRRGQRARRPAAPRGCEVLLRQGPQGKAGRSRSSARQGRLSRESSEAKAIVFHACAPLPGRSTTRGSTRSGRCRSGGASRQGRLDDRHGRRVSGAAGRHGPLLRHARRRA